MDCANFNPRGSEIAKYGYGLCTRVKSKATHHSAVILHECDMFLDAEESVKTKRAKWIEKIDAAHQKPKA